MSSAAHPESSSAPANPPAAPVAPTVPTPAAATPAQTAFITYDQFAQLDLRIAEVLEAREHPNANKLLLLKVKVGDVEKQIVAGIKAHYTPESLVGKLIVIVNNLEPAMLRGEESNGMLLAASDAQRVVLLQPEQPIASGSKVK